MANGGVDCIVKSIHYSMKDWDSVAMAYYQHEAQVPAVSEGFDFASSTYNHTALEWGDVWLLLV